MASWGKVNLGNLGKGLLTPDMALMIDQNKQPVFQISKFIVVKYRSIGEGLLTGAWITQDH